MVIAGATFFKVGQKGTLGKWFSLVSSLSSSLCAIAMVILLDKETGGIQFREKHLWLKVHSIFYDVGLDGTSAVFLLLIAIIFPLLIAYEWKRENSVLGLHALFLLLQTALSGVLLAQDFFLLLFFWGFSALPFYFLIGIWGGEQKEVAAFKYIVVSSIGTGLIFAAMLVVFYSSPKDSLLFDNLINIGIEHVSIFKSGITVGALALFLMLFGIFLRIPFWPLHGWFLEFVKEAPLSVIIAFQTGVIPVGLYLFLKILYALFPTTILIISDFIVYIGVGNVLMGAFCASFQNDLRKVIGYFSLCGVGLVLIGFGSLSESGLLGGVFQLFVFALSAAGLGIFCDVLIKRKDDSIFLNEDKNTAIGGAIFSAPVLALVLGTLFAANLGFPGTGGFVGYTLLMIGAYAVNPAVVILTGASLVVMVYCFFMIFKAVFLGQQTLKTNFMDINKLERLCLFPIIIIILFLGVYPKPVFLIFQPSILKLLSVF